MPGFAAISFKAQNNEGPQRPIEPVSVANTYKMQMDSADSLVKMSVNAGAYFVIGGAAGPGVSLQQAYNRSDVLAAAPMIDVTGGVISLQNNNANGTGVLTITKSPAGAQAGNALAVTSGANATAAAVVITHNRSVAGAGTQATLRLAGNAASVIAEFTDGQSAGVSNATEGRLIYDNAQPAFRVSIQGGAYTNLMTAVATTLQAAYNGGATITTGANGAVAITKGAAAGAGIACLTLTDAQAASTANALTISKTSTAAGNGVDVTLGANATGHGFAATLSGGGNCVNVTQSAQTGRLVSAGYTGTVTHSSAQISLSHTGAWSGGGTQSANFWNVNWAPTVSASATHSANMAYINQTPTSSGAGVTLTLSSTLLLIEHNPTVAAGGAITDTSAGLRIIMTPQASSAVRGLTVLMNANTSSAGFAATFDWRAAAGTASGNGIVNVEVGGAGTTFTGVLTGVECDLRTSVNGATAVALTCYTAKLSANMGSNASIGLDWSRSGTHTTNGSTFTGNAINIQNTPTGGVGGVNVTESGVLVNINHAPVAGAGTTTDTTTGIAIAMTPSAANATVGGTVTMGANATGNALTITHNRATAGPVCIRLAGANQSVIFEMTDGRNAGVSAASEGRLIYNSSTQRFQVSMNTGAYVNLTTGTAATSLQTAYDGGNTITTAGALAVSITNSSNDAANAVTITRSGATATGNGLGITFSAAGAGSRAVDITSSTASGTIAAIRSTAVLATASTTMLLLDGTTGSTPGVSLGFIGLDIRVPADTLGGSNGLGGTNGTAALAITTTATRSRALDINIANTGGQIAVIRYGGAPALGASLVGFNLDLNTGVGASGNTISGHVIQITNTAAADSATTVAAGAISTAGSGALIVYSRATLARVVDVLYENTAGTIMHIRDGNTAAAALTAQLTGLMVNMNTNVSPGTPSNVINGQVIQVAASTAADSASTATVGGVLTVGSGAQIIYSRQTLGRVVDVMVLNTQGTISTIRYPVSTTLTATALVGLDLDLTTNTVMTNNPPITGIVIRTPATTAAAANGQGALAIESQATVARVVVINPRNVSGIIHAINYTAAGATTLSGALEGMVVNLSTNVTAGAQNVTAFRCTVPTLGTGTILGLSVEGQSGQAWEFGEWSENLTLSTLGTTTDTTQTIPANSFILGIDNRITATITVATDWAVGDATTSNRFAAANATLTVNTTSLGLRHLQGSVSTDATGPVVTAATAVRVTTTGTPGAGSIRITVRYIRFAAATS